MSAEALSKRAATCGGGGEAAGGETGGSEAAGGEAGGGEAGGGASSDEARVAELEAEVAALRREADANVVRVGAAHRRELHEARRVQRGVPCLIARVHYDRLSLLHVLHVHERTARGRAARPAMSRLLGYVCVRARARAHTGKGRDRSDLAASCF